MHSFKIDVKPGEYLRDYLHPECAAMRFIQNGRAGKVSLVPDAPEDCGPFAVTGPTSRAMRFALPKISFVSIGLRPAGWARFIALPASGMANRIIDGTRDAAFAIFAPLLEELDAAGDDHHEAASRFDAFLMALHEKTPPAPSLVLSCQEALRDPQMRDVDQLCARVGTSRRTLERLCGRHFGFSPKTLLRRQRFLRSLGRFMLESRNTWSAALDTDYFDQAHFVRDFRSFMGITPSEYAEMPHPVLDQIMAQRMLDQGAMPLPPSADGVSRKAGDDTVLLKEALG